MTDHDGVGTLSPRQGVQPPNRADVLEAMVLAERAEGWLARCADAGCYVALNAPFVDALAALVLERVASLRATDAPVLEVCAGDGTLAQALRDRGIDVLATDVAPPPHAIGVEALGASEALQRYSPAVVVGSFVPIDAGVDRQVMQDPHVREYIVLNARLAGECGAACVWTDPGWERRRLEAVTAAMITRHDVWLHDTTPILRFGEAWRLTRQTTGRESAGAAHQRALR